MNEDEDLGRVFVRTGDLQNAPRHFVMGDSHSLFFAGAEKLLDTHAEVASAHEGYRVYYVGPGLAASIQKQYSRNRTREKINMALEEVRETPLRHIIFSFGEVDCRFHIRKRAAEMGQDNEKTWLLSTKLSVMKYLSYLLEIKDMGFQPIIWGPPPTTPNAPETHQWITLGTMQERNFITRQFTAMLSAEAARHGIPMLSVFDDLVGDDLITPASYSTDAIHLSQRHWPLWREKFKAAGFEP